MSKNIFNITVIFIFFPDKTFEYLVNKTKTSFTKKERQHKNEIRRLRQKMKSYKIRLQAIQKTTIMRNFENFTKNMSESAKLFTRMQFMEGRKKKQGRRFTQEEKILSLSLFKKSPKAYKLMCKHFTLPSRKVLKSLLAQIKLSPGINPLIFEELKETVSNMVVQDRLCTLIFDEMSITPQLHYNIYTDDLVGFENYGKEKTANFANHVLVFMVKGVKRNFKQPVAYYFTQTLKTTKLKEIINEVITNVQATGLKIIATVCDQSSTNVSAINNLIAEAKQTYLQVGKEWRKDIILINNNEIIPLYDTPHLIKGIRNNLLNKEMIYVHESKIKNVKWEYFQRVFAADRSHGELRLLPKLTIEHIEPEKIKKMRVKNAVQVLSYSMAVATDNLVARGSVPEICREVIPFILMVDKVFDSLNGSSFSPANGKQYRCAAKRNSPHHELWNEAIKMFQTIKFMVRNRENRPIERSIPSVNNLIKTIEGFKSLWQLLFKKYGFDAMMTRNFNQDPLENFFGSIRSLGARNVTPNCMGFEGAFKTLLLNNFSSNHSTNANCEEDTNDCLQSLSFFIKNKERKGLSSASSQSQNIVIDQPLEVMQNTRNISDQGADQRTYVCGWALSKCLQKVIKGCKKCKSKLLGNSDNDMYKYIKAKEYTKNKKWLCYPSDCLVACFQEIQETTVAFLNNECFKIHIKERIKTFINLFIDFQFIDCNSHKDKFQECFVDTSINIIIYSWCRSVNRILDGKLTYDGEDITKLAAQAYCTKHKTHKK